MAHAKLFDVISCEMSNDTFVQRSEIDDFNAKSQLIVAESQEAVFFKEGKALDLFGPGRHTLNSANLPIIRSFYEKLFDRKTVFPCSVFFVNKVVPLDMKWGTDSPIELVDPQYGLTIHVGAFGQMGVKIKDARKFIAKISGQLHTFTNDDVSRYIKGAVMQTVKVKIAEAIMSEKISIQAIAPHLKTLAERIQGELAEEFDFLGLELCKFYIMNIRALEEDMEVLDQARKDYVKGVFAAKTARESRDIQGYDYRTERQFDVMEEAAGNAGAGNVMAPGLGLGMGFGLGKGISNTMAETSQETMAKKPANKCPKCGAEVPTGAKFCPGCGEKLNVQRFCSNCGQPLKEGDKFCANCGTKVE